MAATKKKASAGRGTSRSGTSSRKNARSQNRGKSSGARRKKSAASFSMSREITLWLLLALSIIIFICNLGKGGTFGQWVSAFFFGAFGLMAYLFPVWLFIFSAFLLANQKRTGKVKMKLTAGVLLLVFLCVLVHLFLHGNDGIKLLDAVADSVQGKNGGGLVGSVIGIVLVKLCGMAISYVITIAALIISVVLLTERSLFGGIKKGSTKVYETARRDAQRRKQQRISEEQRHRREEEALEPYGSAGGGRQRRMDKKVSGVAADTKITPAKQRQKRTADMNEIQIDSDIPVIDMAPLHELDLEHELAKQANEMRDVPAPDAAPVRQAGKEIQDSKQEDVWKNQETPNIHVAGETVPPVLQPAAEETPVHKQRKRDPEQTREDAQQISSEIAKKSEEVSGDYAFPDISLLKKGNPKASGDSRQHLQEMSAKLQMTLTNFGVKARVTNVTCGPSVTRYEVQPEMGVKVSKIVGLTDDIKLNLAVADIRMEAPIPGKAAIGIEVPNRENVTVAFRDLIESREFQGHRSNISFAAGKDIAGNVIVADIAKMPHLLIAGATGSGKSVCINTIIMSILYKAHPDDVKLIMIDPKVVELSVYNGIPHLFIPVVTDPKKAAGALHWAVAEMDDRYQKFSEYNVRDLNGYNKKVESISDLDDPDKPKKMPQIVIIVDELADLMMVAPGDVEDAICRLAQLARAAGIHLIIATQRPSVNVITGLIKANMPSRIAFSVTSGVDSRTILDMNGAEKLLGKGDMLFYPQGYQKPVRVQGAFVSDREVSDVVAFLTEHNGKASYDSDIEEKVKHAAASSAGKSGSGGFGAADDRDAYFVEAGKFIIEKEKGSIGMLQRMFKVGFNRAARIMDQLEEAGVVGPEEGTKPRRVLMSLEQFEQYVDEYV